MALREIVYADESGIHDGAPYCIVAGFRGSPGQWKRFNREWNTVLQRYGVGVFHGNVFFNRKRVRGRAANPYHGWADSKARQFLGQLLQVVRGRRIHAVGCAVDVRDYNSYSHGERCALSGYATTRSRRKSRAKPHPYHVAFRMMVSDAVIHVALDTSLHFVFGIQQELQQRALEGYNLMRKLGLEGRARQLKGIAFEDPADFPGIQAADLLVYSWYSALSREAKVSQDVRLAMNQLTHNRNDLPTCGREVIEQMFNRAGFDAEQRAQLRLSAEPS